MAKYNYKGPEEFRPISPWAYFGYSVLFTVPLIGLIVNIVLCFDNTNINKRNFARAFWCIYAVAVIAVVLLIAFGGPEQSAEEYIAELNKWKNAGRFDAPCVFDLLFHRSADFKLSLIPEKH